MSKSIKNSNDFALSDKYELVDTCQVGHLQSLGLHLRHKKSGARLVLLSNEDNNKVFYIGFRTPSYDSTGVAHIVEHTVLCGSEKFPSKDPFVELVKGSLNTFLNAITYPDRTLYPVASCNDKDFRNLMHVYLDAVFYPNLYKNKAIFEQEGWHYEIDEETGELVINGVVYNEMKGAFSSPDTVEDLHIFEALFPDSPYGKESGGDPDVIPLLTYESYLDFHKKFYHPSNSYIYLYGDFDLEERLAFLDEEYLSKFDKIQVDSEIPLQKPVKKDFTASYSVASGEETKEKTFLSYNVVAGEAVDLKLTVALSLIQYVMTEVPGAPIKRALTEAGIGNEIYGAFSTSFKQPVFSIHVSGSEADRKQKFVEIIEDCFREAVKNGIPEKMLRSAIHYSEFKYREQDFGRYPKGLLAGIKLCETWFYDESLPFKNFEIGELFDELRGRIGTGYFEDIIEKYILLNEHKAILALIPEKGFNDKKEEELKQKLLEKKNSMTTEELEALKKSHAALRAFQETPSTVSELMAIPMLAREDITKEAKPFLNEEREMDSVPLIFHKIETNEIVYLNLNFDASDIPFEDVPYLNLLGELYSLVNTEKHEYNDFVSEILMNTGGISSGFSIYPHKEDNHKLKLHFSTRLKVLESELSKGLDLLNEMLFETKFQPESDARIKEILRENLMRMQLYFEGNGDKTAIFRGQAHTSVNGMITDKTNGIGHYRFLKELLDGFEEKKTEFYQKINGIIATYFVKERAILSLTASEALYRKTEEKIKTFVSDLKRGSKVSEVLLSKLLAQMLQKEKEEKKSVREAYTLSGQVQFVSRCGNFRDAGLPYTGLLNILQVILSYDYLWLNVRVKGGAYGCYGRFDRSGDSSFVSYRDPNLMETNEVYEGILSYLNQFSVSERDMTKYIIGAISNLDLPQTPYNEGNTSFCAYLSEYSYEDRQKLRNEILNATAKDIQGLSSYVKAILESDVFVVVGSEAKIKENAEQFDVVQSVLQ